MGSVLNPLDWPELLQERLDPQTEGDIAVATGAHPDPNATAAERDQFAGMRSYERREYVDKSYGAPANAATGGPAIGGSWLGRPIMYGMDSDGNVPPPPPAPASRSVALSPPVETGSSDWLGTARPFWEGVAGWLMPQEQAQQPLPPPASVPGQSIYGMPLDQANTVMDYMFTGDQGVFGSQRQGFYATGAMTAAAKTLEDQQIWTAPWNIGQFVNPFAAAAAQVDETKPWQQQVGAVGAFGQAIWADVEHNPLIGPAVQVSERTGASVLYGGLAAVQDLITAPIGGKFDRRTGITTGGLSVLEAARGVSQVVIEPLLRSNPEPMDPDPALNQPFTHDLAYMYAWEYEQRRRKAEQQYIHDKQTRVSNLAGGDVAAAVSDGGAFGVGARPANEVDTMAKWWQNLSTLPQVYGGMQQARNPESYQIPLSSLSPEEAEAWRLLQRSAWGVRDTQGPGWLNVAESYTANVRFIERKDDALRELDQQIKLMGILSHATVDLGTTANDEVRQVLANNGLDFLLRGMPFEMPGQPSQFGAWGLLQPPKDDSWMFKQDPIYGGGWRRSEQDYIEALTLLGRQGEIQIVDSAGGARYTDPVHQWLYDRGLIGSQQFSDQQLAAAYAQDRAAKGPQYGSIGPARDPRQFGIDPMLFGATQAEVNQGFEDIRERAGVIQNVLRVQRDELRNMDQLDWQGKMLDWRPMLMWGMLLDPFDWYARGVEAAGLGNKGLRAAMEHFGIVELSNADAVRNIERGVQGLPPMRSPGGADGTISMHGGLGWGLFTSPESLYPEMRASADDILEMIASGSDLDRSEAIGARARIAEAMIKSGLVDPALAAGGDDVLWGADKASVAQLLAQGSPQYDAAVRLSKVADVDNLSELSGQVYHGLQVPKAQQLELPRGFGALAVAPGVDTKTLTTLQSDIASRYLANLYREPSQKEIIDALAGQKGVVPWQKEMYGYLGEANQALSQEDPVYKLMIPLDMETLSQGETQGRSADIYRMILGMSEMEGSTGINVDVFSIGYDPASKNLIVPLQLQTADVLDSGQWMLGNMHSNPQAVVRGRMTADLAMYKFRLYGAEAEAGAAGIERARFPSFDEYIQTALESRGNVPFSPEEMAAIEADYNTAEEAFSDQVLAGMGGSLPKTTEEMGGKSPQWNADYFNSLVLQNARGLVGGYDTKSAQFFAKMYVNEPKKFAQVQKSLLGYGVYLEPLESMPANGKAIMASVQNKQGESVQQGFKLHYYNEKGLSVPGLVDPYAQAFDYDSYWKDWWQASSLRRAQQPNFSANLDKYPLVPVQLQRVFDDTQVGLRMEKSQAAASQVTYYNAEKWLYEMLAGASADAPAGSKIYAPRADTAGKAGAVGPAGVVGLGGGTDLGLWAGPDGVFDTRVAPQVAAVDLKTMMVADLALEQQGLPYYIDWDAVTRGPQGYDLTQIPLVKGRPEGLEPSTWRSGYLRMDEKYQEALAVARGPESLSSTANRRTRGLQPSAWGSTQISPNAKYYDAAKASGYLNVGKMGTSVAAQASGLDTLRLSVLPELMETWEAGGKGSVTVSRYDLMSSYRNLSRVAADSGLVVQPATPVKLENGMYQLDYKLRPILETDPAWVSAGGDPSKAMQTVSQRFMDAYFKKKKVGDEWVPAPFGHLPLGELVQKAQAWAGDVRSMLPGTAFDRAQGAVAHNAALNAGTVPYGPQLPFGPGVVTYEFGLPSTKVAAPAPGSMPAQTDILNILEQGNDPRFVFGVFIPGTSGVTSGVNPDLVVKNQRYGKSQGFDLYSRLEQFLVDKLGPLFGTPGGASATSPVLTRDIPHGGTMEVKGDPNYVRWPGDQEPGKPAFKSGTGIASGRGRKLGEGPRAHDAYLLGPREAITEGDAIREAENSDKFDFWGSDEEVPTDPNGAAYALGAENKETQRLQSASDTALEYGGTGKQKEGWLADEEHKLAGMEATPALPLVPYVELPRGMSQYDGPDGLRQFYIDRITAFRDYMGKSAAELGITADEDAARTEIARQVWGSINENPIVKIARGTLEKYTDAVHMTSEVVGAAAGTNKLSGNWVWNEVEKKAEWVARQFNIPGMGLHIWPNYGGQGERGVWQLELPAGSFTVSAQPAYLPGGETMMPSLPSARDTQSAYALRTPKEGGDEWWWWGSYGWRDPHSGQGFLFNTKDGGPKHWKILHETPNQTVIGPLWDPQYYFTAGKRWQPQLPETWSYLDLEKIGARVPDDQFKGFLSFMSSEELKLNTYESVWPWMFSPAPGFLEQLPPTQLGLFTPNVPALRQELEVEKLAKKQQMEHAIRTSLALFNDNLPYIENFIRKTLGITDPQGVAAEVQRIYNEAVARHEAKLQDALAFGSAIADYDEEFAAATEFIDNIKQLTTPEEIAANSQRVWNTTMANFGQWVDNAPKGWTEAELAGMQAAEAQKAAQAEDSADWAEWEQGMAQRAAEVEAARVPGNGTWQVIDRWDEVTTLDVDGRPMTVYPQTRIAPASFKPLEYRGKGAPALTEEEVQDAITRHNWLTSGPSGEFTPVSYPTGSAQPAGPRRKTRWDSFWKNSGDLPGTAEDGSITMGGGFGAPAPTGAQPDFTGGLSKEDRATIRAINDAINSGSRKFADLSDEEWELMFRGWERGGFNYPKTYVGWPDWAIERREKRVDYDGWVRGKSPRKMPVVRPFNPNASEVDLGRTARISTGDLSAALQSTDQKRGVYATERTQILDVVQQPNGQYVVVTHDGMFVQAYVMDDVRPELLKTDKVTTLKKGQALGIGVESPFERTAWMGEHGIMDSIGASFSNASPGSPRGAQEGYLPKTSRASQAQSLEGPPRQSAEDEEELTPIQRLQGTTGEQEPPPAADRSLTPGQRLRLKNLGYSDDQMLAMTPERRAEVLREGIDAADTVQEAYGAGWLGGPPTAEDVAASDSVEPAQAATGAGPTGGYRVPAEPNTDRFGWTMRLRNDQGMSEVGLVVDQAERGGGSWYRVRTRDGSEHWVSSANAQFVTPATDASRAAAAAPAQVATPAQQAGPFTPGEMPGSTAPFQPPYLNTALQLGRYDDLMDTLSPAYADEAGQLHTRNRYQQVGAETYRLGQTWHGPLAQEGAAPQFRAGDIVVLDGERGPDRAQVIGVAPYTDPIYGVTEGYKLHDGRVVSAGSIRGLAWQNLSGRVLSPAPLDMTAAEMLQARKVYESGLAAAAAQTTAIVPYTPPNTAIAPYGSGAALAPTQADVEASDSVESALAGTGVRPVDEVPAGVTEPVESVGPEFAHGMPISAGVPDSSKPSEGWSSPEEERFVSGDGGAWVPPASEPPPAAAAGGGGAPPTAERQPFGEEPDDWTPPEGKLSAGEPLPSMDEVPPIASDRTPPGFEAEQVAPGVVDGGIPVMMTNRMKAQLAGMGYSQAEINAMTPSQAWAIINGGSGAGAGGVHGAAAAAGGAGAGGGGAGAGSGPTGAVGGGGAGVGGAGVGGPGVGGPGAGLPGGGPAGPVGGGPAGGPGGAAGALGAGPQPWYQRGFAGAVNNFFGPGGAFSNAMSAAGGSVGGTVGGKGQQLYNSVLAGAQWIDNRLPFTDTARTKGAKFRDQWSMVAAMLTSATTDQRELAFLLDAWAKDPEEFMARGVNVKGKGLFGLEAQADEYGYFSIDPRIFGNQETADTLPIIQWMSPAFSNMATVVRQVPTNKWGGGDMFMKMFSTFLDDAGTAYYGVTEPGPVGKVVKGVGDVQRHVQAEMVLNLNPGNWIGNWMGAWATGAYEGYGSFKTTGEFIEQTYKLFNASPTERLRDSLEGRPTGSRKGMVWSESKLFRPAEWLKGIEPIVQNFTSKQNKWAVHDWFEQAERAADTWNPLSPFANLSDTTNRWWTTMTHLPFTGGRVRFGEAANYWGTFGAAQEDALGRNFAHAFDQTLMTMAVDDVLSASPEGQAAVGSIMGLVPNTADDAMSRSALAQELQKVIAGVQDPDVKARLQTYVGDMLLHDYDAAVFASLRTAVKGANTVMLNPEYLKNIDTVMGPFMAFSYFTTRTASNWSKRMLLDPRALGWWSRWERASDQYGEQNEVPIRFKGMLPGPFGYMLSNPINFLLGINKMMPGNPPNPDRADNLGDMAQQYAGMFNLRIMPGWMALLSGDPRNLWGGFFPQGEVAGQVGVLAGALGGMLVNTMYEDDYAASRKGRAIAASQITTGQQDYDVQAEALQALQALFETMWGIEPKTELTPGSQEALKYGEKKVAFEGLVSSLSRMLTGYTVKAPIDPDEQSAMALSAILKSVMPQGEDSGGDWDTWKYIAAQWPGLAAWHAQGDLYPTDSPYAGSEPAERIDEIRPTPPMISKSAYAGFEWPVWDTYSGRLMESAQDSPFADPGDNTAIYMLVDPRTGRVHYVGQSVAPSERINQHIEEFDEKGWDHPKTAWIGDMLREGVTPEMYVFDWEPGSTKLNFDKADQMEQLWIGFLYYELGNRVFTDSVNVSIPTRETWEQLVTASGMTKEQLRATFTQFQQDPKTWDRVRLSAEPNLERSPFSGLFPYLPRPGLPVVEQKRIAPDYGINFGTYLPGEVGPKTTKALHEAGIMTWEDLANPANQKKIAGLDGVSEADALEWMQHANVTLAVQRGEATVPTDGRENEVEGAAQQFLVYPLTPAAEQAGEAGAMAAIQSSGRSFGQGTPHGNFSMVFMPSIGKDARSSQDSIYNLRPALGTGAATAAVAGVGGAGVGGAGVGGAGVGGAGVGGAAAGGGLTLSSLKPAPAPGPLHLSGLQPASQRAGAPAPNPWGPGQSTPFATVAAVGTDKQKSATVIDNGKRPMFAISSPFGEVAEWNSGQKPYTVLPSTWPTFDLERDASIAQHKQKAAETHAKFQEQFGPPNDPSVSAAGFMGVLSWIFTPSPEVATAKDFSGVYNYPERTRMEQDAGRRQERAYYDEVNKRTNTSLIAGAAAVASGVGYALIGGMVGTDNARLFWKGAGLGATWWAGANGYLGWDLGKKGGGKGGPVIPPEGGPPQMPDKKSTKYMYFPGWRPNVKPGIKFELPILPDGTQIWVPDNMLSIEGAPGYQNADWLNNPQFDPAHPEESLARIQEVYGKAQPVPLQWLSGQGAFFGPGPHLDYEQRRTILTGRKALEANPYGVAGAGGMWQTQGAPDPRTQPELNAKWQEEVLKPRGEYGIWLRSPLGGDPLLAEGYGDNKADWEGREGLAGHAGLDYAVKPQTTVAAAAPGQVIMVGEDGEFGRYVIVQHDWGQTIYGNLDGIGVAQGDWLAAGDTIGMAGGMDVKGNKGNIFHFGMQVAGVEGPEGMGGWVDPTPYLPSTGDAGASGWKWTDVPGVSTQLAQMLNDAGITNPDQLNGMDPAAAAALVDQFQGELGERLDAEGGWQLVRNTKALLSMGNKPQELIDAENKAKAKALEAAGGSWGGLEGPGTDPNAPYTGTRTSDGSGEGSGGSGGTVKDDGDIDDDGIRDLWDDDVKEPDLPPEKVMGKILAAPGEGVNGTNVPWSKERDGMRVRNLNPDLYPGLTPALVDALHDAHIYSVEQLLEIAEWDNAVDAVAGIKGIGKETAKDILRGAIKWDERRKQIAKGEKPNEKLQEGLFEGLGKDAMAAAKGVKAYDISALATANPADLANFSKEDSIGDKTARDLINQARAWQGLEPLPEDGEAAVTLDTTIAPGQVKGVGPAMIETFNAAGIYTYRDALAKGKDVVDSVKGVGETTLAAFWGKVVEANGGTDPVPADGKEDLEWLHGVGKKTEQAFYEAGLINEQALLELDTPAEIAQMAEDLGNLPENPTDISAAGLTEAINEVRKKVGLDPLPVPVRGKGGAATVESIKGTPDDLAVLGGMDPKIAAANDIDQFQDLNRWSDDALMALFGVDEETVKKWRKTIKAEAEAKAAAGAGVIVGGEPQATPTGSATPTTTPATPTVAPTSTVPVGGDILNGAQQRATGTPVVPTTPIGPVAPTPLVTPQATPTVSPTPTPDSVGSVVDPAALASSYNLGGQLSGFTAIAMRGTVRDVPLGQTLPQAAPSPSGRSVTPAGSTTSGAAAAAAPAAIDEDDLAHRVLALFWRDLERNMRTA